MKKKKKNCPIKEKGMSDIKTKKEKKTINNQ